MNNKICYTGVGSSKKKYHKKKAYLKIMDKNFKGECKKYHESFKCKSCKQSSKIFKKLMKLKKKSNKASKKFARYSKKCMKCKSKRTKKCDFNEYINFSGAEIGKC